MSNYLGPIIIERKKLGIVEHPGLRFMCWGQPMVIHNSFRAGEVIISTYQEYAEGNDIIVSERYKPAVPGYQMEMNARRLLGKKWRPWYNCQHFITEVAGLRPDSRQWNQALASVALLAVVVALKA